VTVTSQHAKNPAIGWDISAAAKADAGEKIARAQIIINGLIAYDKRRRLDARPYLLILVAYILIEAVWITLGRPI